MKKILIVTLIALLVLPSQAHHRHDLPVALAGLAAGTVIGATVASATTPQPTYVDLPSPVYVAPAYQTVAPVYQTVTPTATVATVPSGTAVVCSDLPTAYYRTVVVERPSVVATAVTGLALATGVALAVGNHHHHHGGPRGFWRGGGLPGGGHRGGFRGGFHGGGLPGGHHRRR